MARPASKAGGDGRSWFWVQGLACGVVVATSAPLALVLGVLFAPALLAALMLPPGVPRRVAGILLVYGLAGALPWMQALWATAQSWPASLDLLSQLGLAASCWGAQAAAWLLGEIVPFVARLVLDTRVRVRANRLREARSRLQDEWGLPAPEA